MAIIITTAIIVLVNSSCRHRCMISNYPLNSRYTINNVFTWLIKYKNLALFTFLYCEYNLVLCAVNLQKKGIIFCMLCFLIVF